MHPDPATLPPSPVDGPGRNRFDDPLAQYAVRYVAKELTGCLVETLARFRPNAEAETRLRAIAGFDDPGARTVPEADHPDPAAGLEAWLERQQIGRLRIGHSGLPDGAGRWLPDVNTPLLLVHLDKHPMVRAALERSLLGTALTPARLDEAIVRLGGPVGRPITQALGRAVREWLPDARCLAYYSRIDDRERCWALWDTTPVSVHVAPLSREDAHHRQAVRRVAALLEIRLPTSWA